MNKLIVCIMGQNVERFIEMSLTSVKDADAIIFCDGGSTDDTLRIVEEFFIKNEPIVKDIPVEYLVDIIHNEYNQEDPHMNGKQRNFYLKYLKENYPDDFALCLDADEVVEDLNKIKEFIQFAKPGLYDVQMRHLIGDLAHEDANQDTHFVMRRLFKISEANSYPCVEHPVLAGVFTKREQEESKLTDDYQWSDFYTEDLPGYYSTQGGFKGTVIWHMSHINEMFNVKQKYENHVKKSNIHTPDYLKTWYHQHLFGKHPKKEFNPVELPKVILDYFGVDRDELYFANRGLEMKHFIDAIHWKEFFKCKKAIEFGCGKGPRVFTLNHVGIRTHGFEISDFAVNNKLHKNVFLGDILSYYRSDNPRYDLTVAYDLLEHLKYEDLGTAIKVLKENTKHHILISIPVIGDPNLLNDPTHIIKESKEWWIKQFTDKGLKQIKTPDHFLFKEQIIIFEK